MSKQTIFIYHIPALSLVRNQAEPLEGLVEVEERGPRRQDGAITGDYGKSPSDHPETMGRARLHL